MKNNDYQSWTDHALEPKLVARSLITALIVGSILNIINQWSALLGDESVQWTSLLLTFLVPYAVSTFSGVRSAQAFKNEKLLALKAAIFEGLESGTSERGVQDIMKGVEEKLRANMNTRRRRRLPQNKSVFT